MEHSMITSLTECRYVYHVVLAEVGRQVAKGQLDPYVLQMYTRAVSYLDQCPASVQSAFNVLAGMSKMGFDGPDLQGELEARYHEAGRWLYGFKEGHIGDGDPLPPGNS